VKLGALSALHASGISSLILNSAWRKRRLAILAYHGMSLDDEHLWNPYLYVPAARFRRRMHLIRDLGCNVLPLDEALVRLSQDTLPPRSVVLTFDDGGYDFYREAYPVLRGLGFPATLYVPTYYMRFNRPVYDLMCSYLIWKGRERSLYWPEVLRIREDVPLRGEAGAFVLGRLMRYPCENGLSGADKDELLRALAEQLGLDYDAILRRRMLHVINADEAREIAAGGIDLQLHTHRHRVSRTRSLFVREIEENRAALQPFRTTKAAHFCYPGGVHRPEFPRWLRELNVRSAVTTDFGLATRRSDPMLIPRFLVNSRSTDAEFMGWITGSCAFLPSRRFPETGGQFLDDSLLAAPSVCERDAITAPDAPGEAVNF
jgi:peptidoglycan/xylan/chitin deacetylase (PgdA/CDA1 family)